MLILLQVSERNLEKKEGQIEALFTDSSTRNLFPELDLPHSIGKTPSQRVDSIVDIVIHSSVPLNGIVYQRDYRHDEEFSVDNVYVSTRRRGGVLLGVALQIKGFSKVEEVELVHDTAKSGEKFLLFKREQHSKPWRAAVPTWEAS